MARPPPRSAMYLCVSMSSARFAKHPTAWRAVSTSPPKLSMTMPAMQSWLHSTRTSSSKLKLHRHAATSRCTSTSTELAAEANEGSTPARTSRPLLFGLVESLRSAARAKHWLCTLLEDESVINGGIAPKLPIAFKWSGLEARLARQNVAYSRTSASGDCTSAINVGRQLAFTKAGWFASLEMRLVSAISECRWLSTSLEVAKSISGGRPPCTTTCTCVVGWFDRLHKQMAA
mmetsp:Transcript_24764/g.50861  ORF Transcript_24764/g.50861 Transcript_24764/m.50861 type:complete len:232 (-) Transcript_24764:190-885(-)